MMPSVFVRLILAHLLGDFVFNSFGLAVLKRSSALRRQLLALAGHCGIHALLAALLLGGDTAFRLKGALLVFALHLAIDFTRSSLEIKLVGPDRVYMTRSELMGWLRGRGMATGGPPPGDKIGKWFLTVVLDQGVHLGSLYWLARFL